MVEVVTGRNIVLGEIFIFGLEEMLSFCLCVFCVYRNYMNDTLRTNVFVRFQAETIACACIFLAARALQVIGTMNLTPPHVVVTSDLQSDSIAPFKRDYPVFPRYRFHPDLIGTCCLEPVKTRSKRFVSPH